METPDQGTFCDECGEALPWPSEADSLQRRPCPSCGGTRRQYRLHLSDEITAYEHVVVKAAPAQRDPSLPEGGVTRAYQGVRRGRDGRLVERTARYDPHADLAEERVVDLETGQVIVDKSESMREKYIREGRLKPPAF